MTETEAVVEEVKVEVAEVGKKKAKVATGNLILDIAHEVESLSKTQALNQADKLSETVDVSYFRLGGILKLIKDNSWFEGYASFEAFVEEKYGFASRKASYLISIYDNLVTKQIPWEKVSHLGWTKLKELAPVLTPENTDEWVAKAEKLTYAELMAVLKPPTEGGGTAATSDGLVKINFKLKADQADIVQQALAKAKGELKTEYDTVALENICSGYVGGTIAIAKPISMLDQVNTMGIEVALAQIAEAWPQYDITLTVAAPQKG